MLRKLSLFLVLATLPAWAQVEVPQAAGVVEVNGTTVAGVHYLSKGKTLLFPVLDVAAMLHHPARYDAATHTLTCDGQSFSVEAVTVDDRPYLAWADISRILPDAHLDVVSGRAVFGDRPQASVPTPDVVVPQPSPPPRPRPVPSVVPTPEATPLPPPSPNDLQTASQKMDAHDYAGALAIYQRAMVEKPDDHQIVYNAGLAAYLARQYELSVALFSRYHAGEPDDWQGFSKLCQACEAAGQSDQAEDWATRLRTLWFEKTNTELSSKKSYVRDQFEQGGRHVMVFEIFDPIQTTPCHVWDFVVIGANRRAEKVYFVERDPASSEVAQATGQGKVDLHFFDLDEPNRHTSYLSIPQRPSYAEAKKTMLDVMAGKYPARSSSTR